MLCGVLTLDRDEKPSSYEIICEEATVSVGVTLRLQNSYGCLHFYEVEAFGESSVIYPILSEVSTVYRPRAREFKREIFGSGQGDI